MPLYEYVCRSCDAGFEKLVRRFDEAVACPSCHSAAVEKQLSVFAVASASPSPSASYERCGAGACGAAGRGGEPGPCGGGVCGLPS